MLTGVWRPIVQGTCSACGSKREESGDQCWHLSITIGEEPPTLRFCPPCVKDLGQAALRARATDDTASMLGVTDLEYRWNQAAAGAGFLGLQPEAIFEKVQEERKQ